MIRRTHSIHKFLLVGLAIGLFASGCSGEFQTGEEASVSPTSPQATSSTITRTMTSDAPVDETDLSEVDDGDSSAYEKGEAPLLLALQTLSEAQAFRMTVTVAQNIQSTGLGINVNQRVDPDRPATMAETDANGNTYTYLDLGPVLSPLAAGDRSLARILDDTHIEMWITPDRLFIDSTGYQGVADLDPLSDLGPFTPGVGYIDLVELEELAGTDLVNALVGNGLTDPIALAEQIPLVLANIEQDPTDPNVYTATSTYAAIIEAQGQDIVALTRSLAIGIAPSLGVSVDELAAFYQGAYEQVLTEVIVTIGSDGSVESIQDTTDLAFIFELVVSEDSDLQLRMSDREREEFRALFADTVWVTTRVITFELDDSIVVTPPTGDLENRTQLAREFFAELIG